MRFIRGRSEHVTDSLIPHVASPLTSENSYFYIDYIDYVIIAEHDFTCHEINTTNPLFFCKSISKLTS